MRYAIFVMIMITIIMLLSVVLNVLVMSHKGSEGVAQNVTKSSQYYAGTAPYVLKDRRSTNE